MVELSIVIPLYNEEENVNILYSQLKKILDKLDKAYEIIFIDDGSTDSTFELLNSLSIKDNLLRTIQFENNQGQSFALSEGFKKANGKVIISMDGDLQNDPNDLPNLLNELSKGYDVVCGWRYNRKDSRIIKTIPSKITNWIGRKITKVQVNDYSCTLRAYKKETVKNLKLFRGAHRMIPIILSRKGFNVGQVKVNHNRRLHGKAKYNSPFRLFECISGLRKVLKD